MHEEELNYIKNPTAVIMRKHPGHEIQQARRELIHNNKNFTIQVLSMPSFMLEPVLALELVGETGLSELRVPTEKLVDWFGSTSSPDV